MFDDDYGVTEEEKKRPAATAMNKTKNTMIRNAAKGGWLKKQSTKKNGKWSFRYFALVQDKVYIYKQPTDKVSKYVIDFSKATVEIDLIPEELPSMMIISQYGSNSICVKARDSSELEDWASEFELVGLNFKCAPNRPAVYRGMMITGTRIFFNDIFPIVDTGDLLLLRSGSNTFQVSLFICYPDGEIGLLQADSIDGVRIQSADEIFEYYKPQKSISLIFRQLRVQKTSEILMKFEEFMKTFEKKKFSISPISLIQSTPRGSHNEVTACSAELIASAYKSMGFLNSSVAASRYTPHSFSQGSKLELIGSKLANEVEIDLGS